MSKECQIVYYDYGYKVKIELCEVLQSGSVRAGSFLNYRYLLFLIIIQSSGDVYNVCNSFMDNKMPLWEVCVHPLRRYR